MSIEKSNPQRLHDAFSALAGNMAQMVKHEADRGAKLSEAVLELHRSWYHIMAGMEGAERVASINGLLNEFEAKIDTAYKLAKVSQIELDQSIKDTAEAAKAWQF